MHGRLVQAVAQYSGAVLERGTGAAITRGVRNRDVLVARMQYGRGKGPYRLGGLAEATACAAAADGAEIGGVCLRCGTVLECANELAIFWDKAVVLPCAEGGEVVDKADAGSFGRSGANAPECAHRAGIVVVKSALIVGLGARCAQLCVIVGWCA